MWMLGRKQIQVFIRSYTIISWVRINLKIFYVGEILKMRSICLVQMSQMIERTSMPYKLPELFICICIQQTLMARASQKAPTRMGNKSMNTYRAEYVDKFKKTFNPIIVMDRVYGVADPVLGEERNPISEEVIAIAQQINLPRTLTNGVSSELTEKNPEQVGTVEETEKTNLPGTPNTPGSLTGGRFEPIPMTPETPVQCSTSKEVSEISVLDGVRSVSSLGAVEKEASVGENQELDLSLMNEEINLSEGDPVLVADGWSVRTRMAARYLCKSFLNRKQRKEEDVLNLLEIVKGRTKKESARFFYEILRK